MIPSWSGGSRLFDPQRLNRYGHARESPLKFNDPDGQDLVPTNETSAAQLKADLDRLLTKAEAANIKVEQGTNVQIIDSKVITKPSPAYNRLLVAIKPGVRREYNAVPADSTVTLKSGDKVDVGAGVTVFEGTKNQSGAGATVIEIFVPTDEDGPLEWGSDTKPIALPRFIITAHEPLGHATCGDGLCAVNIENQVRESLGLPTRSGSDHQLAPGEKQPPGPQLPPTQATVTANPELIPTPAPPPPTFIVPKPLQKPEGN